METIFIICFACLLLIPGLLRLLKSCTSFTDLLALGGLAGWWENTTPALGIPELKEEAITVDDVRQAAAGIQFTQ